MPHFTLFENDQKTCDVLSDFLALKSPLQNFCVRIIACLDVDQTF